MSVSVLTAVVSVVLAAQLMAIRPVLNRRSDRVLAGENPPQSRAHLLYIGAEGVKTVALLALGIRVLAA